MTTPPRRGTPPDPPPSGREQMRDAVDQVMKKVADQKQETKAEVAAAKAHRERQGRMRWLQAAVLSIVLLMSLMFAIPRWRQPFSSPTGARAERDGRRAVVFAAQLVEQRIRVTGRAPQHFTEVGVPLTGISYERLDSASYVISTVVEGKTLSFRRGDDAARFAGTP